MLTYGKRLSLGEAFAAVHRTVAAGLEGDLGLLAAFRTDSGIHFATDAAILAGVTAGLASLRLVGETFFSVEFLFAGSKGEFGAAFFAGESLVFVHG